MIRRGEIQKIASASGLRDTQIEKDYIIGWILNGIANQKYLKEKLVFKGGTSLRKIYFPDYRLSEDLDFTFADNDLIIDKIIECFNSAIEWIKEESRITLSILNKTEHGTGNVNFYLAYVGPLGGKGENKRVKIDISGDEILFDSPEEKNVANDYSDLENFKIKSYTLSEIITEKMRSLMQRSEPRDLFDLWYLFENEAVDIEDYIFDFKVKAEHKNLDAAKLTETVERKVETLKRQWSLRLVNQIHDLPNFDDVWRSLGKHWRKYNKITMSS
jgi:predicted nucleotidyltransferase component of viral defense system